MAIFYGVVNGEVHTAEQPLHDPDAPIDETRKCWACGRALKRNQRKFCCREHMHEYEKGRRPRKWAYFNG